MLKLLERKEGNQCYKYQELTGSSIKLAFTSKVLIYAKNVKGRVRIRQ